MKSNPQLWISLDWRMPSGTVAPHSTGVIMKIFAALLLAVLPSSAHSAQWICVVESATGFHLEGSNYVSNPLKAGRTYLLRPVKETDDKIVSLIPGVTFVLETVGNPDGPVAYFDTALDGESRSYSSVGGSAYVSFHPTTLKFVLSSVSSYVFEYEAEKYPPFMEIGACSAL